jgi:p-aminobenzoyl-glutamate transporter AbgT
MTRIVHTTSFFLIILAILLIVAIVTMSYQISAPCANGISFIKFNNTKTHKGLKKGMTSAIDNLTDKFPSITNYPSYELEGSA